MFFFILKRVVNQFITNIWPILISRGFSTKSVGCWGGAKVSELNLHYLKGVIYITKMEEEMGWLLCME